MLNFFCSFFSNFKICVWIVILSVVVGLFVIKRLGWLVSVIVIMIFCFCLLDNWWGYVFIFCFGFWILIFLSSFSVLVCVFLVVEFLWICRIFLICFFILCRGLSVFMGFWKIIEIWLFCIWWSCFLLVFIKFLLLNIIFLDGWLVVGYGSKWSMERVFIDFLELDLLIRVKIFFLWIWNDIFLIVLIVFLFEVNDMFKFLMLRSGFFMLVFFGDWRYCELFCWWILVSLVWL